MSERVAIGSLDTEAGVIRMRLCQFFIAAGRAPAAFCEMKEIGAGGERYLAGLNWDRQLGYCEHYSKDPR